MSTAAAAPQSNLFFSNDTVFGVCAALGQDFGFNPTYLRVAFAAPLIFNPVLVIGAYLATGVVVLASRILFPVRLRKARRAQPETAAPAPVQIPAAADDNEEAMAVAA